MASNSTKMGEEVRLHNLAPKEQAERLPLWKRCLVVLSLVPVVNLVLVPFYVNPPPESIRAILQTTMIVNCLALARIHFDVKLDDAAEEDAAEFKRLLGDYARIVMNSFSLNVFLLLFVVLANPTRTRARGIEVWKCLRWGVLMLFWLMEFYLIQLFNMYTYWGRIVYQDESLAVFGTPTGVLIYGGVLFCIIVGSLAMVNEVVFNLAEEHEKGLFRTEKQKCPFIYSLHKLPATQSKLALEGLTYKRLRPFKDDSLMLYRVLCSAGLEPSDCLDVIAALQEYAAAL